MIDKIKFVSTDGLSGITKINYWIKKCIDKPTIISINETYDKDTGIYTTTVFFKQ